MGNNIMRIWVDADACPNPIKEILFRAAERTKTKIILVSNQLVRTPVSSYITKIQVSAGFDMADNYIVKNLQCGDLVITADIPLADAVISKKGIALNPRGELYSEDNIKQRLSMRNLNEELRNIGMSTQGPPRLNQRDIQTFANCLDRQLLKIRGGV